MEYSLAYRESFRNTTVDFINKKGRLCLKICIKK